MSTKPEVGEPNWSQFIEVETGLTEKVRARGKQTDKWPKQVPEWFVDAYRKSLPEERGFLGSIFGNLFRPTLREVLARTPEEVSSLFEDKAQQRRRLKKLAEQLRAGMRPHTLKGPDGLPPNY